ncbi:phosphohydrolase [Rhizobium leguminosarum]|uniref:metallophosphoesterase n=1 Tax=Rhizobium leguminosarum TaxID=384 RepID=UPI001C948E28|nr:metallophosphoesterase [Rhizobium leguminosarum]MBY5453880.1 phosphohydrolase [Rhizobium leguminosarum]
MKAWIVSDLHMPPMAEVMGHFPVPKADICINAGDTSHHIESSLSFLWAAIEEHMPVVTTLGNHDFYGSSIDRALEIAKTRLEGTNVHVLENDTFTIGDLRIIGATLWTDFEVPWGIDEELPVAERLEKAFHVCPREITDFREIRRSDERKEGETGFITIQEMIRRHEESRTYIEAELAKPFAGNTMVLSHHAPSPRSIHPEYRGYVSNAAFASDLSVVIREGKPDYWVHGHVHHFLDYQEGETRILCNARGYAHERHVNGSKAGFVIDI